MALAIDETIPDLPTAEDPVQKESLEKALDYMALSPGSKVQGQKIDVVFIGSCTNGRLTDLRMAAAVLQGHEIANGVRLLVVPGSEVVRAQAEAEGIDKVVRDAGGEWRYAGCSMCIAMNGDQLQPGQYAVSTSNRNFEGRQGKGGRTFLASPYTAAASAITGRVTDPREFIGLRRNYEPRQG
jgi:3-isopropylmalate/(R)-2-methylmalate dehydratase large subunit